MGILNFYHQFLRDKASIAEPLHRLLDKNRKWTWTRDHQRSFERLKGLISADNVLIHYDLNLPLGLVCDASPYGVGAVLFHTTEDDVERPIAFYSRTLSKTERNYSQLDRESTAIMAGIKKFHDYLYGRSFTLFTDHRPLLGILGETKPTPAVISAPMLRRRITLGAYDYHLAYRCGSKMGNADFLSRAPLPAIEVKMIDHDEKPPADNSIIERMTRDNKRYWQIMGFVRNGWPPTSGKLDKFAKQFYFKRNELSCFGDCLMWGDRIVVPDEGQKEMLRALHTGHPGIVKMKSLARSHLYWPGIDNDIEKTVRLCNSCQEYRNNVPKSTIHHWEQPPYEWSRLNIDFAGPFHGKYFLIIVDAFSKWIEAKMVSSTSTDVVVRELRFLFATHGLPDTIVSDNGTAFTSREFKRFCADNLISHVRSPVYHPQSNGEAERAVQTTKNFLKKIHGKGDWNKELARFLLNSRTTPSATTGQAPCDLLMKRSLRTYFTKLKQEKSERNENYGAPKFLPGQEVWGRVYNSEKKWAPAVVQRRQGRANQVVTFEAGKTCILSNDQLRTRFTGHSVWGSNPEAPGGLTAEEGTMERALDDTTPHGPISPEKIPTPQRELDESVCPNVRKSSRQKKQPDRFQPGVEGC